MEPRRQALRYLAGLLPPLASENGWTWRMRPATVTPDGCSGLA
jgi:hypothetical protein